MNINDKKVHLGVHAAFIWTSEAEVYGAEGHWESIMLTNRCWHVNCTLHQAMQLLTNSLVIWACTETSKTVPKRTRDALGCHLSNKIPKQEIINSWLSVITGLLQMTVAEAGHLITDDSTTLSSVSETTVWRAMASRVASCFFLKLFKLWDGDHSCESKADTPTVLNSSFFQKSGPYSLLPSNTSCYYTWTHSLFIGFTFFLFLKRLKAYIFIKAYDRRFQ